MEKLLLSTAYLPPVSWVREALKADSILIEAFETYPKQTYRNRCRIAAANGVLSLSIPVNKVNGKHTMTKDIEICYEEDWQRLHRRSIEDAYANSPFYLYYRDEFQKFFEKRYRFLIDLNLEIAHTVFGIMGKQAEIKLTENFEQGPQDEKDLRDAISPKIPVDRERFPRYPQVFEEKNGFHPDLSIIDLLFNEGPASLAYLKG